MRAIVAVAGWATGASVVTDSTVFVADTGDHERNRELAREAIRQSVSHLRLHRPRKNTCDCLTDDA